MDDKSRIAQLEQDLQQANRKIRELENANSIAGVETVRSLSNNLLELKESVIDHLHHPVVILDCDLKVVFANQNFCKTFKTTSKAIIDRLIYELDISQWKIPQLQNVLEMILPSGSKMNNFEMQVDGGNGQIKHLLLNASKIKLSDQNEHCILLSIENITKRKIAQDNLKKSQQQFHDLFHSSESLIAIFLGPDHIVDMANDAIIEVWGKGKDVLGKPLLEVLPEIEEQGLVDLLNHVYETGEAFHASEKHVSLNIDGVQQDRYFDIIYQPQRDGDGNIIGVANISSDVTNQALLNEKIKKNEAQFRELVNLIPNKINIATENGDSFYYNKNWLDYTGLEPEELVNKGWLSLVHPEEYIHLDKELSQFKEQGREFEFEARLLNKENEYRWHLMKSVPVKENHTISSWITSCTEIQSMKDEEVHKEGFLKLVSHELKTPVTSIKGYIQLLQTVLPEKIETDSRNIPVKPYLNRIESQIERLIRLISEMLDLSRIEQNELILELSDFELNKQVETVIEDLSFSHCEMQIDIDHEEQIEIRADRERIGQVISNLITNAVKYSPDAKKVSVRIFKTQDNQAAVSVKDYGIGIALKEQQQIFKRFYRVSGNNDDTYEGFGIGLYLSNEIIEKHQGKITVTSEPGTGSEFTFLLPLNQSQ